MRNLKKGIVPSFIFMRIFYNRKGLLVLADKYFNFVSKYAHPVYYTNELCLVAKMRQKKSI